MGLEDSHTTVGGLGTLQGLCVVGTQERPHRKDGDLELSVTFNKWGQDRPSVSGERGRHVSRSERGSRGAGMWKAAAVRGAAPLQGSE